MIWSFNADTFIALQGRRPMATIVDALNHLATLASMQASQTSNLTAAIAALTTQVEGLGMAGMTPEQVVALSQATTDIAAVKADVVAMRASLDALQAQITAAVAYDQSASQAIAALRVDVDALKSGVGDLSGLPALPTP